MLGLYIFLIIYIIVYLLLTCHKSNQTRSDNIFGYEAENSSVLLVTAHPDDECMFFAPTILYLIKRKCQVYVLCLSTGNYYGMGDSRVNELTESCVELGMPRENVFCVDDFPDHPTMIWDETQIANIVKSYIKRTNAKTILTFDKRGVSGHQNHISVFHGVRHFKALNKGVNVFTLESVNIIRKYIQIFEWVYAVASSAPRVIVGNYEEYLQGHSAMLRHKSQLMWFRRIYILFSRYMFINSWTEIK